MDPRVHPDRSAARNRPDGGVASEGPPELDVSDRDSQVESTLTAEEDVSPLPLEASPMPFRDAARYDFRGEHGRGGLGRVLRARDKELGRDVAIKELLQRGHRAETRFLREALVTARLEHPSIVPIHEAGRWANGTPFYAMKLVSGQPLKQVIAGAATQQERLALLPNVIAVTDAIAYAHDRRVIHRDLKPSNVIVGRFGETVVIDWGIAKVLDETEDTVDALYREAGREQLTEAGGVLGTPAYMAPEQHQGRSDERSDIYALGGILYEVITGRPPHEHGARSLAFPPYTPRDLIAIVERAMAILPERRYPRALDLADDLRRFIRRAPVAARRYSLPARFALGFARHRTFAVMLLVGLVALSITLAIAVAKVSDQRSAADLARSRAEDTNAALTLKHVELLMRGDPTAALQALADYQGPDEVRRRQLDAEARGRGVAREVLVPHYDTIYFVTHDADGAVISLGDDRRIQRTYHGATTTLAGDASNTVRWAYALPRDLLAYAAVPAGVSVLDLRTRRVTRLTPSGAPEALAFSSDAARLASLDQDGTLRVWQLASAAVVHRSAVTAPIAVRFAGRSRVVVWQVAGLRAIDLDGGMPRTAAISEPPFDDVAAEQARLDADDLRVAFGGLDGSVTLYSTALDSLATVAACHGAVRAVRLLSDDRIGFGCRDGAAGVVRHAAANHALVVEDRVVFPGPIGMFAIDPDASTIVVTSGATAFVHDLRSGMTVRRDGHPEMISAVSLPPPGSDAITTADAIGTVRIWDRPAPPAHVLAELSAATFGAAFAPDGRSVTTFGPDGAVRTIDLAGGAVTELRGHSGFVALVVFASDGETMATASWDGTARVWRRSDGMCLRVFTSHHSVVQGIGYLDRGKRLVSVGNDGTLRAWSVDDDRETTLFQRPTPLVAAAVLGTLGVVVVQDGDGDVWSVTSAGAVRRVRAAGGDPASTLRASLDGKLIAIGTEGGATLVYRTQDWTIAATGQAAGAVWGGRFDPLDREFLVSSADGRVHVLPIGGMSRFSWSDLVGRALDIAYAPDGNTVAIAMLDGGTWLFHVPDASWRYVRDHAADQRRPQFSPDGKSLVTTDAGGTIVLRDVVATFAGSARQATGDVQR
jgi:eukaryotic-like serine/threonine-protein kinase